MFIYRVGYVEYREYVDHIFLVNVFHDMYPSHHIRVYIETNSYNNCMIYCRSGVIFTQ